MIAWGRWCGTSWKSTRAVAAIGTPAKSPAGSSVSDATLHVGMVASVRTSATPCMPKRNCSSPDQAIALGQHDHAARQLAFGLDQRRDRAKVRGEWPLSVGDAAAI